MTAALTSITAPVTFLVLGAGLLHAVWNAIAKSIPDQRRSFALLNVGAAVPCLVLWPFVGLPASRALGYLAGSVACHLAYEVFLMQAYAHGTLSRSYPIARGVSPVLTSLGGLVFAGERLGGLAIGGVALVVVGVASLALRTTGEFSRRGLAWALATGASIAVYTVVDGIGVRTSHDALRYAVTLFAVQCTIFTVAMARHLRPLRRPSGPRAALGAGAGALSVLAYGAVLYAQTRAPLGVVSALRETGVLWAALIGVVWFRERGGWRLATAAAFVAGGVAAIALA